MKNENTTRNHRTGIARQLRRSMQAIAIFFGLFGIFQPATSQVVRDYRVTSLKPFQFEFIGSPRPLNVQDTVNLARGNKVHVMAFKCRTSEFAEVKIIRKREMAVGDTLQRITKL